MDGNEVKKMIPYVVAVVSLAVIDVVGIAVLEGFKDIKSTSLVDPSNVSLGYKPLLNATNIDYFIDGLIIFGVFMGVIVLALVGKIIISIFRTGKKEEY